MSFCIVPLQTLQKHDSQTIILQARTLPILKYMLDGCWKFFYKLHMWSLITPTLSNTPLLPLVLKRLASAVVNFFKSIFLDKRLFLKIRLFSEKTHFLKIAHFSKIGYFSKLGYLVKIDIEVEGNWLIT